uniref:Macaca fascicularis brain cDNA clone: QflA-16661, similar to human H3 histone, family 3B (H3.3B) (H3F3B), mRNA, RefSeq: NM_005324.3 n=1 Tax=Macaca fascicularis TaxID=9541 RepID=I7G547_MACFA|nr:unnamed protein product [Macaca fascicularis]
MKECNVVTLFSIRFIISSGTSTLKWFLTVCFRVRLRSDVAMCYALECLETSTETWLW